jgi:hypothetical protein
MAEEENENNGKKDTDDTVKSDIEVLKEQMALIKDYLPKTTVSAPTGEVTVSDTFGYFVEPVAYASAKKAALALKDKVQATLDGLDKNAKILIVGSLDSASNDLVYIELLLQFRVFDAALKAQIDANKKIIDKIDEPGEVTLIPIGTALLTMPYAVSAMAEIASYFRTDYKMSGRTFTFSPDALITAIAGELVTGSSSRPVYIYNNYLLDIPPVMTYKEFQKKNGGLDTLSLLEAVTLYCDLVNTATMTAAALKYRIDKYTSTTNENLKKQLALASQADLNTEVILKSAGDFFKGVSGIETGQTQSKMGSAIQRDAIRRLGITHFLAIRIPSAGGDTIAQRSFLWNSNTYLGGLVISYALASVKGEVLVADTVSYCGLMHHKLGTAVPEEFACKELLGK